MYPHWKSSRNIKHQISSEFFDYFVVIGCKNYRSVRKPLDSLKVLTERKRPSCWPGSSPLMQLRYRTREHCMIYWVPGLLAVVVWFSYSLIPFPISRQQVDSLSQSFCLSAVELTDRGRRGEDGGWAKSYDGENAWSSINHSIPSGGSRRWKSPYYSQWVAVLLS
jgi:hypothetical protein